MSGLDKMKQRLEFAGGDADGRFTKSKLKSFQSALKDSYQAEWVTLNEEKKRCLINPDKIAEDYDKKIISMNFEDGLKMGDVVYWDRTDSHWLVYLRRLEEEAYFRAAIIKCNYQIDVNGVAYWVYVKGPDQERLTWNKKNLSVYNDLNGDLTMSITKNSETMEYLSRFKIIKFEGHNWQIDAIDRYSQKNIIDCHLVEYFDNEDKDNQIIPVPIEPDPESIYIDGAQTVKPYEENIFYSIKNAENIADIKWEIGSNKAEIINTDNETCEISILTGRADSFKIECFSEGTSIAQLDITIESLF